MPCRSRLLHGGLLLAAFILIDPLGRAADDWPQWRGPRRDAISPDTGLLKEWAKDGPPLLWTAKGLGRGYSSIAISNGRIFTMGDRNKEMLLIALDQKDGKELWAAPVGQPWGDGGPRCTPTVDGDRVYAISPHGDLVCADAASGKERWRKHFGKDFKGKMMSGWGFSESPTIDGDKLICTPGGSEATLVALDKLTGKEIWRCPVPGGDGAAYASIVMADIGGVRNYITLLQRCLVGVSADGKFLWRYNRIANGTANIPTPIVKGDLVFTSTGYGTGAALLKLTPASDGCVKAEELYFLPGNTLQNHHGGMILIGDHVYMGHGHNNGFPVCVELKSGLIPWGGKERGPGSGSAAVAYADGHLYFRYENGIVALIEAVPTGYNLKSTFRIPNDKGPSWPHPVVVGGKLYLRSGDNLLCYSVKQ